MHTDTIGYKIRLLHNQIHKRMEAKRQENEKEPLTGMQRWTLGFLRDHDGKDIYQKDIETEFFRIEGNCIKYACSHGEERACAP